MQLNGTAGTVTMAAASEPPEPPPRNPDKINASLKQLAESEANEIIFTIGNVGEIDK
ncbi:kazrin-like protein [Anopheles sinensis]|uniref:Kazrin-like protein n=1 Tax=Anopheles sinensis TaxID=74873 RepID=A0A084WKA1_ANOSI|nr:kazrin-like protein [Anopheles sinensis]